MLLASFQYLQKLDGSEQITCSHVFNELEIHKHVQRNGKEMEGFIDYGTSLIVVLLPLKF